jgi:hypothetical protein
MEGSLLTGRPAEHRAGSGGLVAPAGKGGRL